MRTSHIIKVLRPMHVAEKVACAGEAVSQRLGMSLAKKRLIKIFQGRTLHAHAKRSVALVLSFMMLMQPLHAYDTDLISIASGAVSPGKPNVLLILDTSDSMNLGLAWDELSVTAAANYNSHVEYLWNNEDYIARIGCYDKDQSNCRGAAKVAATAFDPVLNHAPLSYDDAYTYGSLPQGYFAIPELKNIALLSAQEIDLGYKQLFPNAPRKKSEVRDYSGIDTLHGDRGVDQASPCKYLLAPNGVARSDGDSICATPIKSKYVWWSTDTANNASPTDARLFSDSFNRFIGEDTVTPFSALFADNLINRGGVDFNTSRGVNYPGGYAPPNQQILNTTKQQLVSSQAQTNRCMSAYMGYGHNNYLSGFIPSTVNAPGPFELNAGYMTTGWMRWQPYRDGVRNYTFSKNGWVMNSSNYPGPFHTPAGKDDGLALGWRDSWWMPPRIEDPDQKITSAGWESLQPDLGGYIDYSNAVLNQYAATPNCSGAWPEYCDLGAATDQFAAKLPRVLAYYGITSIPTEITNSLDFNQTTAGNPLNYQIQPVSGDLRWGFTALRGVPTASGAAGSLPGISSYYDNPDEKISVDSICNVECKPTNNPSVFAPIVNGVNNWEQVTAYQSPVTCAVDTALTPPNCKLASCDPWVQTLPVRQFTSCKWTGRISTSPPGTEASQTTYSGGTCAATCVGDCNNFNSSSKPIANVGNNNIDLIEGLNVPISSSLRCNYQKNALGLPANTVGTVGMCADKESLPDPAEVDCPAYYDKSGTAHPACVFYLGDTPTKVCKPIQSYGIGSVKSVRYNLSLVTYEGTLIHDCTADNRRDTSDPSLANQIDFFNPSISSTSTVGLNIDPAQRQTFGNKHGDGSYSATAATSSNMVVYSSNYLNYKFGAKGPSGRPIGRQTRLQLAKDVLADIVTAKRGDFRFGLMIFNDSDPITNASQGGRVIFPVSDLTKNAVTNGGDDTAEFRKRLLWLEARSKTPLAPTVYEAYLYYAGQTPSPEASSVYNDTSGTIPSILPGIVGSNGNYISPIDTTFLGSSSSQQQAYCLKNIIILITDGGPQDDDRKNTKIQALSGVGADGNTVGTPQLTDVKTNLPFGPPDDKYRTPGGGYTTTTYSYLDEMTNFLNKVSVKQTGPNDKSFNNVITFTIGFAGASSAVLENAGDPSVSGGKYYNANNTAQLKDSINQSLQTAREYVPTLSTPVTPLSALSKSQDADEIYVSSIKPSASLDIWPGNMKKYRLGSGKTQCGTQSQVIVNAQGKQQTVTTPIDLCLIGQTQIGGSGGNWNVSAQSSVNSGTMSVATIDPRAQSFWSSTVDGANSLVGGILDRLPKTNVDSQNNPDVSKRNLLTHLTNMFGASGTLPPGQAKSLPAFDFSNTNVVNSAAFSRVPATGRKKVINKIRGADITKPECSDVTNLSPCTTFDAVARHESPLHSPGVIVTYKTGTPTTKTAAGTAPEQRLFYATINGVMHAVDPRDETYGTSGNVGKEIWGFVPEEVLAQAADHPFLIDQQPTRAVDGPIALLDGQPNVWLKPCKAGASCGNTNHPEIQRAILYFGMRRGGGDLSASKRGAHSFYAIDVTDPDTPTLLWKITSVPDTITPPTAANPDPRIGYLCSADGSCQIKTAFSELGQSWSTPTPVKLNQRNAAGTDFVEGLVFTGGYDPRQDCVLPDKNAARRAKITNGQRNDRDCTGTGDYDTEGRAIYVVDAVSGEPIVTFMDADVANARGVNSTVISPPNLSTTPNTAVSGGLKMTNSVAGAVGAYNMDLDAANTIDRLYVGDMGGVLWRVDIQNIDPTKWKVYPIASLSTVDSNKNVQNDRPLFFQPQVFLSTDDAVLSRTNGQDKYDYVYIATSDFEHPIETGKGVNNKLFMIKDWESRGSGSSDVASLQPAVIGEFADLGNSASMDGYISHMFNVTNLAINPGQNAQGVISAQLPAGTDWSKLQGWYIDFDIDPTSSNPVKQYPTNQWIEVATGPALIYKDRNPASITFGLSILNFTTYRYGAVDTQNCTASGVGYTWAMEATTGAAIVNSPTSQNNPGGNSATLAGYHNRVATNDNGGFTTGSGTTTGLSATPALKVLHCEIVKTATSGALSSAVVGEACSATKAYWYNQLSN